jgi:uncharacterized protein YjiK
MKKLIFLLFLVPLCGFKKAEKTPKVQYLKPYKFNSIPVAEPSDICQTTADPSHFYIVSNRGYLVETDSSGKIIIRSTKWDGGSDYEAICVKDNMIYAMDESLRRVDIMNESDFKIKKSLYFNYNGPRNKGFEGLTYIPSEKKFIAVIEKPAMIWEFNEQFQILNQYKPKQFYELSSVTYHDGFLWFLGDEAHKVYKCDPSDYSIIQQWNIPVDNPEGIVFDKDNNLVIVSDDLAMMFKFKIK